MSQPRHVVSAPRLLGELTAAAFSSLSPAAGERTARPVTVVLGSDWETRVSALRAEDPTAAIVLVVGQDPYCLTRALRLGVDALVGEADGTESLLQAVREASGGRPFCAPSLAPLLIGASRGLPTGESTAASPLAGWASLSAQKKEVARMAALGTSNEEIARRLHLSIPAVKYHLQHVFRRLQIRRRCELPTLLGLLSGHPAGNGAAVSAEARERDVL